METATFKSTVTYFHTRSGSKFWYRRSTLGQRHYVAMAHVLKPPWVVGVPQGASTSIVINSWLVRICVEDVDVSKSPAHGDGAVSSTFICALRLIAVAFRSGVGADTLWAVLQARIIKPSFCAISHTPIIILRDLFFVPNKKILATTYHSGVLFLKLS